MSSKNQILDQSLQFIRSSNKDEFNFENISKFSGLEKTEIALHFQSIEILIEALHKYRWDSHFLKSSELIKNADPLQNLLEHDLPSVYRINAFSRKYDVTTFIGAKGRGYLETIKSDMAYYYEQILLSKTYLMPEDLENPALYAKFITHSLFFLTKENLDHVVPKGLTRQVVTQTDYRESIPSSYYLISKKRYSNFTYR